MWVLQVLSSWSDNAPRTPCIAACREKGLWHLILRSAAGQETETRTVRARALVNAAGPWVSETLARVVSVSSSRAVRLVKGSHFVVPRLFSHDFAYVFQNDDHRVVFAIPHEDDFTLIGTTEVEYTGDPYEARITEDEISYLCAAVNRYFRTPVDAEAIVWFFAGVRPLLDDVADDPSAVTRDYYLEIGQPPRQGTGAFGIRGQDYDLSQAGRTGTRNLETGARFHRRFVDGRRTFPWE